MSTSTCIISNLDWWKQVYQNCLLQPAPQHAISNTHSSPSTIRNSEINTNRIQDINLTTTKKLINNNSSIFTVNFENDTSCLKENINFNRKVKAEKRNVMVLAVHMEDSEVDARNVVEVRSAYIKKLNTIVRIVKDLESALTRNKGCIVKFV
ncbi:hypothetical protein HDU92_006751 [Lobulomyces angularis]|nr:hypothetical protein HDU92_006751 [Lobulomyces angularis]